jgi:hypothetical protein
MCQSFHFAWFINASAFKFAEFVPLQLVSPSVQIYFPSELSDFFTSKFGWLGPAFIYWVRKFSRPNVGLGERESESRKEQVGGCFCWRFLLMVCARRAAHSLLFPPTKHRQPTCTHTLLLRVSPQAAWRRIGDTLAAVILNGAVLRAANLLSDTRFARFIILERV